jgi:integrase
VADVIAAWWREEAPRYSEAGHEREQFRLSLAPVLRLYGEAPAAAFRARELEAVQLAMASGSWLTPRERKARGDRYPAGWCRNVVNRRVVRVRTLWRWAERRGLVPEGSWANLLTLPGLARNDARVRHTERVRPAAWGEVRAVARHCPRPVRSMLILQWWSGMRSGEVRALCPGDVDTSGPVWLYRPGSHKNAWRGQDRVVALGRKCQSVLRPWLGGDPASPAFRPTRLTDAAGYSACYYAQAIRRAAAAAGVKGFHAGKCRHSFKQRVTRALGLDAARAALGQLSVGTTNGYAAGVDLAAAVDAARRLG